MTDPVYSVRLYTAACHVCCFVLVVDVRRYSSYGSLPSTSSKRRESSERPGAFRAQTPEPPVNANVQSPPRTGHGNTGRGAGHGALAGHRPQRSQVTAERSNTPPRNRDFLSLLDAPICREYCTSVRLTSAPQYAKSVRLRSENVGPSPVSEYHHIPARLLRLGWVREV